MTLRFRLPPSWPLYLLGALILALALVTVVGERGVLLLWRLRGEKNQLDEQNYRLQLENESLRQRIARLRRDDFYLEKLAREELNLVRPGDVVYRFSKTEPRATRSNPADEVISDETPSGSEKTP